MGCKHCFVVDLVEKIVGIEFGCEEVRGVFPQCTVRQCPKTRIVHQRNVAGVLR